MQWIEPTQPWALGPHYPRWNETLRDGTPVLVRPITRDDADRERDFIESLSPQSLRYRFLGQVAHPGDAVLRTLTDLDYDRDVAFAAVLPDDADAKILGVSRYGTVSDGASCECAVTVRDDWQRRGLGTLLMRHLIEVAKVRGILFMYSIDAAGNAQMAELASYLGFTRSTDPDDGAQVVHRLLLQ